MTVSFKREDLFALATADQDLGTVTGDVALEQARKAAAEFGVAVTIRNPVTDKVIKTIRAPRRAPRS